MNDTVTQAPACTCYWSTSGYNPDCRIHGRDAQRAALCTVFTAPYGSGGDSTSAPEQTYPGIVGNHGPAQRPLGKYEQCGLLVGQKTDEKNQKYGDAFHKCGDFLRLLYPDGVRPEQYQDMLAVVRIFDKQMRIATDKDALGEDPFADIAGYGLLGMRP